MVKTKGKIFAAWPQHGNLSTRSFKKKTLNKFSHIPPFIATLLSFFFRE